MSGNDPIGTIKKSRPFNYSFKPYAETAFCHMLTIILTLDPWSARVHCSDVIKTIMLLNG